jgi:hypothetical protein
LWFFVLSISHLLHVCSCRWVTSFSSSKGKKRITRIQRWRGGRKTHFLLAFLSLAAF